MAREISSDRAAFAARHPQSFEAIGRLNYVVPCVSETGQNQLAQRFVVFDKQYSL